MFAFHIGNGGLLSTIFLKVAKFNILEAQARLMIGSNCRLMAISCDHTSYKLTPIWLWVF